MSTTLVSTSKGNLEVTSKCSFYKLLLYTHLNIYTVLRMLVYNTIFGSSNFNIFADQNAFLPDNKIPIAL